MCNATLEIFWTDKVSRYDNLDDRMAITSARLSALCGGHAIAVLSDGFSTEYVCDNTDLRGYRTSRDLDADRGIWDHAKGY